MSDSFYHGENWLILATGINLPTCIVLDWTAQNPTSTDRGMAASSGLISRSAGLSFSCLEVALSGMRGVLSHLRGHVMLGRGPPGPGMSFLAPSLYISILIQVFMEKGRALSN